MKDYAKTIITPPFLGIGSGVASPSYSATEWGEIMMTFIEQKKELAREIEELERENRRCFDTIDKNELTISQLKEILADIGTEQNE